MKATNYPIADQVGNDDKLLIFPSGRGTNTLTVDAFLNKFASMIPNLNLIINPNFEIDQRGEGSYTGKNTVNFEPWRFGGQGNNAKLSKMDGYVHLESTASSSAAGVNTWQTIRGIEVGDTVTYSFKYRTNGGLHY